MLLSYVMASYTIEGDIQSERHLFLWMQMTRFMLDFLQPIQLPHPLFSVHFLIDDLVPLRDLSVHLLLKIYMLLGLVKCMLYPIELMLGDG